MLFNFCSLMLAFAATSAFVIPAVIPEINTSPSVAMVEFQNVTTSDIFATPHERRPYVELRTTLITRASPFSSPITTPAPALLSRRDDSTASSSSSYLIPYSDRGLAGCLVTATATDGSLLFAGYGCGSDPTAPPPPQDTPAMTLTSITTSAPAFPAAGPISSSSYLIPYSDRGIAGCLLTGTADSGSLLFTGYGCGPAPPTATTPPTETPATTSSPVMMTSAVTTTSTTPPLTPSSEEAPTITAATSTATSTALSPGTSVPSPESCTRIGTLDLGGALWVGAGCHGASTQGSEEGCSRVGTLDEGGALWAGRGCGSN